jgi:hypothetical protein
MRQRRGASTWCSSCEKLREKCLQVCQLRLGSLSPVSQLQVLQLQPAYNPGTLQVNNNSETQRGLANRHQVHATQIRSLTFQGHKHQRHCLNIAMMDRWQHLQSCSAWTSATDVNTSKGQALLITTTSCCRTLHCDKHAGRYIYGCVMRSKWCNWGSIACCMTSYYVESTCKAVPRSSPVDVSLLGLYCVLSLQM